MNSVFVKFKRIFVLLTLTTLTAFGQNNYWYEDKPNTKADTIAIISHGVKSITSVYPDGNDCGSYYPSGYYKVTFYYVKDKIDSVHYAANYFLPSGTIIKRSKRKLIERISTAEENIRRIHYLNNEGQIIETKNEVIGNAALEGEDYSYIIYQYKDGLLTQANRYERNCLTKKYNYEYY